MIDALFSPYFSEDYSFRVPRDFSRLSFYVCEPGLHKDGQFGKVSIPHHELTAIGTRDEQWYPLQHIDADSEVQVLLASDHPVVMSHAKFLSGKNPFIPYC